MTIASDERQHSVDTTYGNATAYQDRSPEKVERHITLASTTTTPCRGSGTTERNDLA